MAAVTTDQLDALCISATRRLRQYINQCAAQQLRRMRESWR